VVNGINDGGLGGVSRRERFFFLPADKEFRFCYDGLVRIISGHVIPCAFEAGNAIEIRNLAEIPITRF
jgi:hypothetical protein